MAPEQTGRMNRPSFSRDLYSLGVSLYEMLPGSLPFTASAPMEWFTVTSQTADDSGRAHKDVPSPLSAIIVKLLAKTAEER